MSSTFLKLVSIFLLLSLKNINAQNIIPLNRVIIDGANLQPHRIEFRESTLLENEEDRLDAWVYVTTEQIQSWGDKSLHVQWMALTWNGTGVDANIADLYNLGLKSRITPFGAPAGALVESHYFGDSVAVVEANADIEARQRPNMYLGQGPHYNVILWPYVFASIDNENKDAFVLSGFSSYSNRLFFYRVDVKGDTTITDNTGKTFSAKVYSGRSSLSLSDAESLNGPTTNSITKYYISKEPPYFLGKENLVRIENTDKWKVTKRWQMTQWDLLSTSPSFKVKEILEERDRRLKIKSQELPWLPKSKN